MFDLFGNKLKAIHQENNIFNMKIYKNNLTITKTVKTSIKTHRKQ